MVLFHFLLGFLWYFCRVSMQNVAFFGSFCRSLIPEGFEGCVR